MTERITLVVGGFDALATALSPVPAFERVVPVSSTSQLRDLITSNQIPKNDPSLVAFVFADTMTVDTPQDLGYLISQLTTAGWKVLVVELSPAAMDLVRANPKSGFLQGPFRVNDVLYALSNLNTAAGVISPFEQGNVVIEFDPGGWARPQATPAPPPTSPTPPAVAPPPTTEPVGTPATVSSGWSTPNGAPTAAPAPPPPTPPWQPPAPADSPPWQPPAPPAAPPVAPPPTWQPPAAEPVGAEPFSPAPPRSPAPSEPYYPPSARPLVPRPGGPVRPDMVSPGAYGDYPPQLSPHGRRARVITVTSPKGGTGKSTLTLNLAVYLGLRLRKQGKRVCVIDANFQQADAGKLLDKYSPNIVNLSKDRAAITPEQIERYLIERPDLNISALLGPAIPSEANPVLFTGALYNQILEALRPNFDYIFIDTPVAEIFHDIFKNFALPQADFIVVPITPAYHTVMNADSWLNTITQPTHNQGEGIDPSIIGIVLNQSRENVGITEDEIRQELFHWKYLGSIPDTNEWVRALNNNELIATKNIHELNVAFGRILYEATGEQEMLYGIDLNAPAPRRGLLGRLRRRD
jgi:cellulose biosynthesis protein BcsQ